VPAHTSATMLNARLREDATGSARITTSCERQSLCPCGASNRQGRLGRHRRLSLINMTLVMEVLTDWFLVDGVDFTLAGGIV
jgi:hypothetical protein